jgi:DNA polymerase-3 subunit gamma/tau
LFAERREGVIYAHLVNDVHLVRFEPGQVELRLGAGAPATLANRIGECLTAWTARRWVVGLSNEPGAPTLRQSRDAAAASKRAAALDHPLVKAALQAFPEATVEAVRESPAAADVPETPPDDDAPVPEGDEEP